MYGKVKIILIYVSLIMLGVLLAVNLAQAQDVEEVTAVEASIELNQAELDQLLAPIALYPDTVLSQVLVASTYPLELVQAARWRENNSDLNEKEALDAIENKDWDPSVKALVPFNSLLQQLVEDLNWLQNLGDAFLSNETQLLASVQSLRQKAYQQGSLSNNKYIEVVEEDNDIVITPVSREVVYVPYYDTRVVYGNWHWADYPPHYWHRPSHYYWHAGLYWSPRVYIRNSFFFGGFHWRNRHVVVHHSPRRYGRYDDGHRRVRVNEYQRWSHNSHHRRGVRYSHNTPKTVYNREGQSNVKRTRNSEYQQQQARRTTVSQNRYKSDKIQRTVSNPKISSTQQRLRNEPAQTQTRVTTDRQKHSRRPESSNRSQSQQRVRRESVQRPVDSAQRQVKQYQAESRQAAPKQRTYTQPKQRTSSQPKQRSFSQPKQRSYSQPQQRVRSSAQRPSSKVRSNGARQKDR